MKHWSDREHITRIIPQSFFILQSKDFRCYEPRSPASQKGMFSPNLHWQPEIYDHKIQLLSFFEHDVIGLDISMNKSLLMEGL